MSTAGNKILCVICNKEFYANGLPSHLKRTHGIISKEYYDEFLKEHNDGICECGKSTKFNSVANGYNKFCSSNCVNNSESVKEKKANSLTDEGKNEATEKRRKTCLKKYGIDNPNKLKDVRDKIKQTCLIKYGYDHHWKNDEVKQKRTNTFIERYDHTNYFQSDIGKKNISALKLKNKLNYIEENYKSFNSEINDGKITLECKKCGNKFIYNGIDTNIKLKEPRCLKCYPKRSIINEIEIVDYLRSLGISNIVTNSRSIIKPYELDVYLPDYKLAIEHDGLYWHREQQLYGPKFKHLEKTEQCEAQGIQLIHIFEDEWNNKAEIIKSIISALLSKSERVCTARQTKIIEITPKDKNKFLDENHRQGKDKSLVKLGAFYKNELVAVMTFSKSNFTKGSSKGIELNRFCTKKFGYIPGIAGKLLTHYINNFKYDSIFSYADRRYSTGNLYKALGFTELGDTPPSYWYMKCKAYNERYHRSNFMKHMLKNKLEIFDPLLTEYENMLVNEYDRIWDCGNKKFELINKEKICL